MRSVHRWRSDGASIAREKLVKRSGRRGDPLMKPAIIGAIKRVAP
jgi:hypothetical protein